MPPLDGYNPFQTIELSTDGFLSQSVLCLNGEWVSRGRAIEYMANVASGKHSGSVDTAPVHKRDAYRLLSRIRQVGSYSVDGGMPTFAMDISATINEEIPFGYSPGAIDPVTLELRAAANFLVTSEDTIRLEQAIREELKVTH